MSKPSYLLTFVFDRFFNEAWASQEITIPLDQDLKLTRAVTISPTLKTKSGEAYPLLRLIQRSTDKLAIKTTNSGLAGSSDRMSALLLYKIETNGDEILIDYATINEDRLYTKWEAFKTFAKGAAATVASPLTLAAGTLAGAGLGGERGVKQIDYEISEADKMLEGKLSATQIGLGKTVYGVGGAAVFGVGSALMGTGARAGFEAALGDTYLRQGSRTLGKSVEQKNEETKKQWLKDFDSDTPYSVSFTMQIDKIQFSRAFPGQTFTLLAKGVFSPVFISKTGVLQAAGQNVYGIGEVAGKHGKNRGAVTSQTIESLRLISNKDSASKKLIEKEKDRCRNDPNCLYFIGGPHSDNCRDEGYCKQYWNKFPERLNEKRGFKPKVPFGWLSKGQEYAQDTDITPTP